MLYHLFEYLEKNYTFPGELLYQYISFRSAMAIIFSLGISTIYGKRIINYLSRQQIGESVRDLGLEGQTEKAGTPTMGGIIIIIATLIPVLLFAKLNNIYVILLIVTTLWMGAIGFLDDYIKTFRKDKEGLKGIFKVFGQVGLGVIVGATLFFHPDITIKENPQVPLSATAVELISSAESEKIEVTPEEKSTKTTIPFVKNNEFDYASLITWINPEWSKYAWLIFIPIVIFIVTAVSNGANLTDGIDGLAAGTSAIIVLTLGLFAWVSGNIIFSDYLNVMYIPRTGEMTIYISAFAGALVGFLWYNTFPAQVFMGDTGSLTIGGIIAVLALATRKELLIPILCGVFLIENLSVVMQVGWFKYTRKKYGEGRRVFLMSPLHHHFQKAGFHESKIVVRFWIIGIFLAIVTIVTLKIR
ncbi:Phospho-N-acetylmuramoyl-pentapeptide-transferase [Salinimicrobium catena]|uniref:Phospho-N-acetylmuramoyl-pentapeptide-transferase n=1 Tax=Salinimicrobium catena TaxID=390640 RepID=A0A1H5NZI7_9FLAO|nr:phospho-N-acetylmuramoyl-pentapeptide-transferase [Salinimicrobium catena]SDL63854.1 Phospho-N-acetylmuramoyl-pentapeptide-transferase [Salinimicrobium catena]SEF06995.1 Phospho-N-acetylmuramoyl-pentapeptide-transferase [Salinimicrobium catena]